MSAFATLRLPACADVVAPDGCDVRVLARLDRGSAAHFTLAAGATSRAVVHRTVDEVWYFLSGRGELWRRDGAREEVSAFAVTMPPWPEAGDADPVEGRW